MATPPTVLAVESSPAPAAAVVPVPVKFPMFPLLAAVLAGIVITGTVIGIGVFWLARTGRLPLSAMVPAETAQRAPVATHIVALDPLVVNLADAGGSAYLRVAMVLQVADAADKKGAVSASEKTGDTVSNEPVAEARDVALTVLGQQTSTGLLAVGGKERLKTQLKAALADHDPELKVMGIFFTDFLVQR